MTQKGEQKTVRVRPVASPEEHTVTVEPGQTPRETLAEVVGRNSDQMMLRSGEDGYLDPETATSEQVRDGETVHAVSNPIVG